MKCVECGTPVTGDSRFCAKCEFRSSTRGPVAIGTHETVGFEVAGNPSMEQPGELFQSVKWLLIKDYDVQEEVGRGGMAVVYRATEIDLGRTVALKVLPPEMAIGSMSGRFKREARMAASLDHPNIIPVYRVGNVGKIFFIAMKFIEGRSLGTIAEQQGALPVPIVLQALRGAAHALAYAHENGIIHRDIKGANILIQKDGRPVVSDFGVARAVEEKSMTAAGAVIGTPFFMSPEQCAGKQVGPQSDQYSLGVVAFQLLTGAVPFDADSLPEIMQHHWFTPVPDIASVRQDVPAPLLDVIYRSLAKDPKQRFPSTTDMAEALDAIPMGDKDRQWGNAMLKELANGTTIPKLSTGSLPPLHETLTLSQKSLRAIEAPIRRRRRNAVIGAVSLAALAVIAAGTYYATRPSAQVVPPLRADSAAAASGAPGRDLPNRVASAPNAIGTVRVRGLPAGGKLVIDGRTVPPAGVGLAPGNHDYTISADGYRTASGRVTVISGDTTTLDGLLARIAAEQPIVAAPVPSVVAKGKLRLRAEPADAEILIDDRSAGRGVLVDYDLPAGSRRVRITAEGYTAFDTMIVVRAGETTALGRKTLRPVTP